jgi:hypothetical protein
VVLLVLFGLAAIGSRRRRSNENWRLSPAPNGAQAERNATGVTVTGGVHDGGGAAGGF